MGYNNLLSGKFASILNNSDNNHVKIDFKTYSIKVINYKTENIL